MHIEMALEDRVNRVTCSDDLVLSEVLAEFQSVLTYFFPASFRNRTLIVRDNDEVPTTTSPRPVDGYYNRTNIARPPYPAAPSWQPAPTVVGAIHATYGDGLNTAAIATDDDPL